MEINQLPFHGKIKTLKSTMKTRISVFMAMNNGFMGFSLSFHGIFIFKQFIVSSSDNVGNLSFSLLLLTRSREKEKSGKFRHYQITMRIVCRDDAMLCVDWLISITCSFFVDLIT